MSDAVRLEKLKKLRELGINPYPYTYNRTHGAAEIIEKFNSLEGKDASIAGRIIRMRAMGKLYFLDLLDGTGKIQVIAKSDVMSKESAEILSLTDRGDILGVNGKIIKSDRGEISVEAKQVTMLSKSLSMLPEKFHGLTDTDMRYRKRYLDLIANPETRKFFVTRAKILSYMRNFFDKRGYVEFETPILQPTYGGATGEPFTTHHNALDSTLYLRIADELYLKRLIIGGFEKVYEVSKDFRNEDIDSTHNPEFTQIEAYETYKDYNDFMKMFEELFSGIAKDLFGSYKIKYQGRELDFTPPFMKIYLVDEIKRRSGIDISKMTDEEAKEIAKKENLATGIKNAYHVADALFDKYVKPDIWNPTFVLDYPIYMCPLTKTKRDNELLAERFEPYIAGIEVGNCYTELTDPQYQNKMFEEQDAERQKGDEEAPPSDRDFLEAIEYGMPPTAGIGISIDRPAMMFTDNASIKEVIAFPSVRPEKRETAEKKSKK